MKEQIFESENIYDSDYIIRTVAGIVVIIITIVILYYVIKLYRKLIKYLDKNS